jgi:hypothetical protein
VVQPRADLHYWLRDSLNSESGRPARASLEYTAQTPERRSGSMAHLRLNTSKTCVTSSMSMSMSREKTVFVYARVNTPSIPVGNNQFVSHPSGITLNATRCPHAAAICVKLLANVPTSSSISDRSRISTIAFWSDSGDPRSASTWSTRCICGAVPTCSCE